MSDSARPQGWRAPARLAAAVALGTGLLKCALAAQLELDAIEAYHWFYAQNLDLGYFDHPGMVGWMIALSKALFGDGVLGVRALSIAFGTGTVWLTFLAGRRLYDERAGLAAAALAALVPLMIQYGNLATPDAPLLFFSIATVWALAHALSGDSPSWWFGAGVFVGGAMDSKYTAIFLPVCVVAFVVLSPEHRVWLRRPHPYLACLIALAVFSPTIVWNVRNDFASFRYQGLERLDENNQRGFSFRTLKTFVVGQLTQVTPWVCLIAYGAAAVALKRWRTSPWQDRFVAVLTLPVLLFFAAVLVTRSAHVRWTVPSHGIALLLVAAVAMRGGGWARRGYDWTVGILAVVVVLAPIVLPFVPASKLPLVGTVADAIRGRAPGFVTTSEYHLAAQLGYALRPLPTIDSSAWGRGSKMFPRWWKGEPHRGQTAVIVFEDVPPADWRAELGRWFDDLGEPETITLGGWRSKKARVTLVTARGYRVSANR